MVDEHTYSYSNYMVSHSASLLTDLEILTSLTQVAINIIMSLRACQEAAVAGKFDAALLDLIRICVKITSRGYDGDNLAATEVKWTTIIAACK